MHNRKPLLGFHLDFHVVSKRYPVAEFDSYFHLCYEACLSHRSYPVSSAAVQQVERALKHSISAIRTAKASLVPGAEEEFKDGDDQPHEV